MAARSAENFLLCFSIDFLIEMAARSAEKFFCYVFPHWFLKFYYASSIDFLMELAARSAEIFLTMFFEKKCKHSPEPENRFSVVSRSSLQK